MPNNLVHHASYRKMRAVDKERVARNSQRCVWARGIDPIANGDLIMVSLGGPAPLAHVLGRINVELKRRFGKYDRADVTTFHHHVSEFGEATQMSCQVLAHRGNDRNRRN